MRGTDEAVRTVSSTTPRLFGSSAQASYPPADFNLSAILLEVELGGCGEIKCGHTYFLRCAKMVT